jgi:hypothetical protein
MQTPSSLYTAENCRVAYQLNWSVSTFPKSPLPPVDQWLNDLAYTQGMQLVFKFSYFVGTFGTYDRQEIRQKL